MEMPDFGEVDNPAIQRRVAVYQAKPLEKPLPKANQWLRSNCMEVFDYVARQLTDEPLFSDDDDDGSDDDEERPGENSGNANRGSIYNDFSEASQNLISLDDIVNLNKDESDHSGDEVSSYDPTQNFTVDGKDRALRMASDIDRFRLVGDDPRWQYLEGDINSHEYHRSVMLLVCSNLRTATFDR